jgi:predicted transcriptional regulator
MEISQWLVSTTAGEITIRDVTTLRPQDTLAAAAELLISEQITGAPVVDEGGIVLGVLSASDLMTAERQVGREQQQIAESSFWHSSLALPRSVYAAKIAEVRDKLLPALDQPVERFMTTDLVSVSEETPLATVIQHMVDAHIHRVLVLDDAKRLVGIVTTTNVLAALLRLGR